jgi:hypothetical protein
MHPMSPQEIHAQPTILIPIHVMMLLKTVATSWLSPRAPYVATGDHTKHRVPITFG